MRVPALPLEGDTIVAVSTPYGVGGIGIVRISGPDAEKTADLVFQPKTPPERFPSHRFTYGHVCDPLDNTVVDEALMVVMRAPNTYTREDVVEIHCHGGVLPVRRVLDLIVAEGVRLAEPGEFTRRAFMNGRIDLVQAEAVADIVEAKSETALRFAQRLAEGAYDVALADPPYTTDQAVRLLEVFRRCTFARVLSIEHRASLDCPGDETRHYGDTALTFCYGSWHG